MQYLEEDVDERYDQYPLSENQESIYLHCIRAIEKSFNFGENGLPKIGSGDWNDGFSTVGNKGRGESVWLGFFLYNILDEFIPICEMMESKKEQRLPESLKLKENHQEFNFVNKEKEIERKGQINSIHKEKIENGDKYNETDDEREEKSRVEKMERNQNTIEKSIKYKWLGWQMV